MALSFDEARSPDQLAVTIANSQTLAIDDYAVIDTAGFARRLADTTGFVPAGRVVDFSPPDTSNPATGDTTANQPPEAVIKSDGEVLRNISVTGATGQTDIGDLVYASDHETLTLTASTNIPAVGMVVRHRSGTNVDVRLFSIDEIRNHDTEIPDIAS